MPAGTYPAGSALVNPLNPVGNFTFGQAGVNPLGGAGINVNDATTRLVQGGPVVNPLDVTVAGNQGAAVNLNNDAKFGIAPKTDGVAPLATTTSFDSSLFATQGLTSAANLGNLIAGGNNDVCLVKLNMKNEEVQYLKDALNNTQKEVNLLKGQLQASKGNSENVNNLQKTIDGLNDQLTNTVSKTTH